MESPRRKLLELQGASGAGASALPAPRFRRLLALCVDIALTLLAVVMTVAPVQLLWPPETKPAVIVSALAGVTGGLLYLGFAPLLWGNTLGKWLFSLRLASANAQPLTASRLCKRLLLVGLWPINAVMVMARPSRRHLGDAWADTSVQLAASKGNLWVATAGAALLLVGSYQLGTLASRVAMARSEAWRLARAELAGERGAVVPLLPLSFSILDNVAMFHADVGKGLRRIVLIRKDDQWFATDTQAVESLANESTFDVAAHVQLD